MRQFRRPDVTVPTLAGNGPGGKKRAEHISEHGAGVHPTKFPGHWTRPDVRGALYAMHGRICCYCGADVSETGNDVEHFRPKKSVLENDRHGGYWWLAYDFSNYLLSCGLCNGNYKLHRFPMREGGMHMPYEDRANLAAELRMLLDPSCDRLENWITVDWTKAACKLVPKDGITPAEENRVKAVIKFFHVNRTPLRRKRLKIQRAVVEAIDTNRAARVRHLAIRYRPHSLVAKVILEAKNVPLPTPEEEAGWLLDDLTDELIRAVEELEEMENPTELERDQARELFWALAVLWKDPPGVGQEFVESYLEARGLKEDVAAFLVKLS